MPTNFSMLPLMAQLAALAANDPEQFAALAAAKGVTPPQTGETGGAPSNIGELLAGAPTSPVTAPAGPQIQAAAAPQEPTPTPQTAADDPLKSLTAAFGALQAPQAQTPAAPQLAPVTPPPAARGGPNPDLQRIVAALLQPQAAPNIPTLGSIIGGNYRRFA